MYIYTPTPLPPSPAPPPLTSARGPAGAPAPGAGSKKPGWEAKSIALRDAVKKSKTPRAPEGEAYVRPMSHTKREPVHRAYIPQPSTA
jgi:hypothetical protein